MKRRRILVSIDDLVRLLHDYCPDDIPADAQANRLMLRPTEQGRLGIEIVAESLPASLPPLAVKFELRRFHSL